MFSVAFLVLGIKYKTTKATIFEEYMREHKIKLIVKINGKIFFGKNNIDY